MTPEQFAAQLETVHGPLGPPAFDDVIARARRRRHRRAAPAVVGLAALAAGTTLALLHASGPRATSVLYGSSPSATSVPTTSLATPAPTGSPRPGVPAEFWAACGHPGATVVLRSGSGTVHRRDCDLRGVVLVSPGAGGVVVPTSPGGVNASPGGPYAVLRPDGDVSYVRGRPCSPPPGAGCA